MFIAVCLTLAGVHGLVWVRQRKAWSHLLLALSAVGTAAYAGCEVWMMRAGTPVEFGLAMRLCHVPAWLLIVALVLYMRVHMRAGRTWLAWVVCGMRTVSLVLNFLISPNLNFREVTALEPIQILGETLVRPVGEPNPWMLVGQLSLVLWTVFMVDATVMLWRRGAGRSAVGVGVSMVIFTLLGSSQVMVSLWGMIPVPLMASVFYLGIVGSMGYQLSTGLVRSGQLMEDLRQREREAAQQRLELAHLSRVASLSELSGTLAHELNQPLAIILSNAQAAQRLMAKSPPALEEVREILGDIVTEDRRAADVIKRLRALLKRGEPERRPMVFNAMVEEVVALMREELRSRGVCLHLELADGLPLVNGDLIPLEQVVLNLVSNACDAMGGTAQEERHLTILTGAESEGEVIRMSVRDTGCGLPREAQRVFEAFYTTKERGLGLGLSICRSIVDAHGGRIWAEPNPAGGATFHMTLPVLGGSP